MIRVLTLITLIVFSESAFSNQAYQCSQLFADFGRDASQLLLETPSEQSKIFRKRFHDQIKKDPQNPYSFVMPEFSPVVMRMKFELLRWSETASAEQKNYIIEPLQKLLQETIERGFLYNETHELAIRFSMAMDMKVNGSWAQIFHRINGLSIEGFWSKFQKNRPPPIEEMYSGEWSVDEAPIILITFKELSLQDFNRFWPYNVMVIGLATDFVSFDGGKDSPMAFYTHDTGHGYQKTEFYSNVIKKMFPEATAEQIFEKTILTGKTLNGLIEKVNDPIRKLALQLMLFEMFHEMNLLPISSVLKEFIASQKSFPRTGLKKYSPAFVAAGAPNRVFLDLKIMRSMSLQVYGPKIQKILGNKREEFWNSVLEEMATLIGNLG